MIRKAQLSDLQKMKELYFQLFNQMEKYEPFYMEKTHQDEEFLKKVIAEEDFFTAFVYESAKKVEGFAITHQQESLPYNCFVPLKCLYLMDIVVDENARGKGIGTSLLNQVKIFAKENKADYLELNVLAKNTLAEALYIREGFENYSKSMRLKIDNV